MLRTNKDTPKNSSDIDKALRAQAKVCAEATECLTVNGQQALDKLLNKKTKSKPILR